MRERANDGELISEIAVYGLEPIGKSDDGVAVFIRRYVAAVDVQYFGRLDRCVIEVFVFRIERMVDLEVLRTSSANGEVAVYDHLAYKRSGEPVDCAVVAVAGNAIYARASHVPGAASNTAFAIHPEASFGAGAVTAHGRKPPTAEPTGTAAAEGVQTRTRNTGDGRSAVDCEPCAKRASVGDC